MHFAVTCGYRNISDRSSRDAPFMRQSSFILLSFCSRPPGVLRF